MASKTEHILDYLRKIKGANKELTKKEAFKDLLNRLYASDADVVRVVDAMSAGAEASVLNIPRKDKLHRGSADTLYNQVIIEFENDLRRSLPHAKEQLAGYLLGKFRSGMGYTFTLIASDFIQWRAFAPAAGCIPYLDTLQEHELLLEEIESAAFLLTEENAEEFYFYLDRFLFKEERRKATLKLIAEAFGQHSTVFIECLREMGKWFGEAKKHGEVQVSFREWKRFLSIAYGSFDASEQNFLIHTYLSVFAKMLAYSVVSNDEYISDKELLGVLDGSIFNEYHILNFVENDFYHWVKHPRNFHNLKRAFRLIAQEISTFNFESVEEDVLKGVYQELIDLDTRHALGEYYTPDWLCERVAAEYDFQPTDRILDPSCGSGSFLRAAIQRLRSLHPQLGPDTLSQQVYGIDIHPLSVQIAKTTLLIALGPGVRDTSQPIRLNVVLANTLLAPKGVSGLFGSEFEILIEEEKFYLNTSVLEDIGLFDDALQACDEMAESTMGRAPETADTLYNTLRTQYGHRSFTPQMLDGFHRIYLAFKMLKEKDRDSIWKFILQNLYKPYFLAGKFDYIIGNPPWFTYADIRNEQYQEVLQSLADEYRVMPLQRVNLPHLEIAAIFMAYCSAYFLRKNGKLAFVLPRSFFSADQHDNTRSGTALGFRVEGLWDLAGVSPLFRVPSCVVFAEKAEEKREIGASGISGISFSGRLREHNCHWYDAAPSIVETPARWYYAKQGKSSAFTVRKPSKPQQENPYKNRFKQGATIVPRCFYFVKVLGSPPNFHNRTLTVSTSDDIQLDAKAPWKGIEFSYKRIESLFLFRTALSKSILPFALFRPDLVVLPILIEPKQAIQRIRLLSATELLRAGYIQASNWFANGEQIWQLHRTEKNSNITSEAYLNWQNKLTAQNLDHPYLVLYNASAKDANATVVKRTELDLTFIVESTTYWYSSNDLEEAYYLASLLNAEAPNAMMKDFQARGLFGPRHVHKKILDIYFPMYDSENAEHRRLAELGEICHERSTRFLQDTPPNVPLTTSQLGKLRVAIRKHLSQELQEIDTLARAVMGMP